MGVRRTAPWWLTWVVGGGLVALFVGERIVSTVTVARALLSGLGALVVLGGLVWRILSVRAAEGEAREVERLLLLAYGGCVLALVGYLLSSDDGMRWLGIEFATEEARSRYQVVLRVLWPIVLAVSLLPALGAQLALGAHRHARGEAAHLEALRVRETAAGGLVVALAGAFLFVVGYIVSERDKTLDLSYFRTSSPGSATAAMVSSLAEPLRVILFFPEVNPVKDEALRYFRALAEETGRVRIEAYDRLVSPQVAEEHRVTDDGTVLLQRGDASERITLATDLRNARTKLRTLDRDVQRALMTLLRERRVAYLTTGHGELNDPRSGGPGAGGSLEGVNALRDLLSFLNYDVENLGLQTGLGREVPGDAALVIALGPKRPFLDEELAALDRYLGGGGSLLLALDPESEFRLGPLEQRLGVRFVPVPLADDRQHLRQRGNLSDRRLIITDRFSSHEAVTTASRAGLGAGILLVGAGYLETVDGAAATPRYLVRSLPTTFADTDRDYEFDEGSERRDSYNLVAAVEVRPPARDSAGDTTRAVHAAGAGATGAGMGHGASGSAAPTTREAASSQEAGSQPGVAGGKAAAGAPPRGTNPRSPGPDSDRGADVAPVDTGARAGGPLLRDTLRTRPMRALVYADAEMFTDPVVVSLGLNAALVADGIKWLGGEEALAGATESEEDVPIQHTKAEDVVWFYSTILGAPALVLAAGLAGVYRRRKRRSAA